MQFSIGWGQIIVYCFGDGVDFTCIGLQGSNSTVGYGMLVIRS